MNLVNLISNNIRRTSFILSLFWILYLPFCAIITFLRGFDVFMFVVGVFIGWFGSLFLLFVLIKKKKVIPQRVKPRSSLSLAFELFEKGGRK